MSQLVLERNKRVSKRSQLEVTARRLCLLGSQAVCSLKMTKMKMLSMREIADNSIKPESTTLVILLKSKQLNLLWKCR